MKLDYDNSRTRAGLLPTDGFENAPSRSPMELLETFYEAQNGQAMSDAQRSYARDLIEHIWEENT